MVEVDDVLELEEGLDDDDVNGARVDATVVVVTDVGSGCRSSLDEFPSPHDDRTVTKDTDAMMLTRVRRRC